MVVVGSLAVREVFVPRVGLSLVLLPYASSTLVAAGLPNLSLVSVRQRRQRRRQRRQRQTTTTITIPFSSPPPAMSASTHRPSPRSTLPAFPLQRRSRSPPVVPPPSSSHLRRSLSPKGVRLPPIQSLDFAPRPAPREPVSSQPLGTPLQDHYPQ